MQKVTVKEVHPSTAENKPTVLTMDDGARMSGFQAGLMAIKPGSILEIEPEVKGKYINIKDFKILQEGTAPPVSPGSNGSQMSKEDWEKKQRVERNSIEAQTAVKAILALDISNITDIESLEFKIYHKALKWCEVKIDANMNISPAMPQAKQPEQTLTQIPTEQSNGKFDNVGKMFAEAATHGVSRSAILTRYKIAEKDVPKINPEDQWNLMISDGFLKIEPSENPK